MLLLDKKRYAGGYWTKPDAMDRVDYKGIELARRDWTGLCTEVIAQCLDQLMVHKNVQGAIEAVHKACSDVLLNRIDVSKLIMTKGNPRTTPSGQRPDGVVRDYLAYSYKIQVWSCVFLFKNWLTPEQDLQKPLRNTKAKNQFPFIFKWSKTPFGAIPSRLPGQVTVFPTS